jgi:hypothetical protein
MEESISVYGHGLRFAFDQKMLALRMNRMKRAEFYCGPSGHEVEVEK